MQTVTMWLQEQIFNSDWKNMSGEDKLKLFEQAKEMEKNSYICSKCKSQINGNEVMQQMQGSEISD